MPAQSESMLDAETEYGCFFCRSGSERAVALKLNALYEDFEALAPQKLRYRRMGGELHTEKVTLIPGYVFFRTHGSFPAYEILKHSDVYRLLMYDRKDWKLTGPDRRFAEQLYEYRTGIELSKAYYEGDRIRILEGFLKGHEAEILRVNRRAQTAQIRMNLEGKELMLWLGYELIDAAGEACSEEERTQTE